MAKKINDCIRQSADSWSRDVVLPLCSVLVKHIWDFRSRLELPLNKRDMDLLKQVQEQERATKIIKQLDNLTLKETETTGTISLQKTVSSKAINISNNPYFYISKSHEI